MTGLVGVDGMDLDWLNHHNWTWNYSISPGWQFKLMLTNLNGGKTTNARKEWMDVALREGDIEY